MKQKSLLIFHDDAWRLTRLLLPLIVLLCAPAFAQRTAKGKILDVQHGRSIFVV